jgi:quinol monooxygenase YgiN
MSEFVVYLDTSEVRPGKLGELKAAMQELAVFVEANEPRIIAYDVYFSRDGTRMSVLHIHEDIPSLEFHLKIAGPRFRPIAPLVKLVTIEIFGAANDELMEQLEAKTQLLGGTVIIRDLHAGFAHVSTGTKS